MSANAGAAGLATALVLAAAAEPPSAHPPQPRAVTNPDWIELPSSDELSSVYPAAAQMLMIPGRVMIGCRVAVSGDVEACRVLDETPKGEGFGAAALLLTPRFKMRPRTVNGVAVAGAEIRVPISFQLHPGVLPSAPADAAAAPEPSARALALAERIVAAMGHEEVAPPALNAYTGNINRIAGEQIGDPEQAQNRDLALADYAQALRSRLPLLHRARVVAFARTFSEAELGQIADFLEAPAGRAVVAKSPEAARVMAVEAADVVRDATAEARKVYCASRDCGPPLSHGPAAK